jgi:beta-lactamase superfamily II metal-dependent hydrolase
MTHTKRLATQFGILAAALLLLAWRSWPDGRLHVLFLAAGGDAALIQTPAGGYVLIDGGSDPAALVAALGRRMPYWQRNLDAVVLTSSDGRQLPGQIAVLARYHARSALAPPALHRSAATSEWRRLLDEQRTTVSAARPGVRLDLGGAVLRTLSTGNSDDGGLLLRIDYGATSVVFDHAASPDQEDAIVAAGGVRSASLVAFPWQRDPHNDFLRQLRPGAIVFTDGYQADKPTEQTFLERAVAGAALYHERLNGAIEWVSDGRSARVITERQS